VTPLGFLFKFYSGPGRLWFNNYGAGLLYEVFWSLVVFFFVPKRRHIGTIAVGVCIITSILETLQLWQNPFLQQLRSTFLGGALLGNTFVWWDFPHYLAGCVVAWLLMRAISGTVDNDTCKK
jgi:uncharacterized membrane protein